MLFSTVFFFLLCFSLIEIALFFLLLSLHRAELAEAKKRAKTYKERKKHDRFDGMPEEEVSKRVLPDHLTNNLDIIIVSGSRERKRFPPPPPSFYFPSLVFPSLLLPPPPPREGKKRLIGLAVGRNGRLVSEKIRMEGSETTNSRL